jgi:hypothetical protein
MLNVTFLQAFDKLQNISKQHRMAEKLQINGVHHSDTDEAGGK